MYARLFVDARNDFLNYRLTALINKADPVDLKKRENYRTRALTTLAPDGLNVKDNVSTGSF